MPSPNALLTNPDIQTSAASRRGVPVIPGKEDRQRAAAAAEAASMHDMTADLGEPLAPLSEAKRTSFPRRVLQLGRLSLAGGSKNHPKHDALQLIEKLTAEPPANAKAAPASAAPGHLQRGELAYVMQGVVPLTPAEVGIKRDPADRPATVPDWAAGNRKEYPPVNAPAAVLNDQVRG
ncbi:MAG TPA: hypothetical protein VD735_03915 [Candidatus Saccharimonadales bacterium]|nr:hypothetical protein [Candidatus Saccharimonadales bacterium]